MEGVPEGIEISKHFILAEHLPCLFPGGELEDKISLTSGSKMEVINTIQFYCDVLCRSRPGVRHEIASLMSFRDEASVDIKEIVRCPKTLKVFLSNFPQLFTVQGNTVVLKNWIVFHINQQEWLKELLIKNSVRKVPILVSTIQFYCNILFIKAHKYEYPICLLFSLKGNAPAAVQAITKNIKEFKIFLHSYPEIFIIKNDKVTLSNTALSYKSMSFWIKRVVSNVKADGIDTTNSECKASVINSYGIINNEIAVNEAITFYYKIILFHGLHSVAGKSLSELISKRSGATKSVQAFAKNWQELKDFLSKYPHIFTLSNNDVFLTHLLESTNNGNSKSGPEIHLKYSHYVNNGSQIEEYKKVAIEFYLDMLHKMAKQNDKDTEFSINHLFHCSLEAPQEVKDIVGSAAELKNFLLNHPNIFMVSSDNVVVPKPDLSLRNDKENKALKNHSEISTPVDTLFAVSKAGIRKETVKEAIEFYSEVVNRFGGTADIKRLLDCRQQSNAMNLGELKQFFSSYPDYFIIENNRVSLSKKCGENMKGITYKRTSQKKRGNEDAKNKAVLFYSNFMKKQKSKLISLNRLIGHRSCAPIDVQAVARNPSELKDFLSQFSEIFTVTNNGVMFSNLHQGDIIDLDQECSLENDMINCHDIQNDAVEFFAKMLNHFGNSRVLSVHELFEFKVKSSPKIQKISGSNIQQFIAFLLQYPDYFLVTNDNVIGKMKIPKWSCGGKYEKRKFTDPILIIVFHFFRKYTQNKSLFHIDYLYNNVGKYFLYSDQSCIFQSKSDLLLFLALYPHVFYVDCARVINIITSSRKAFIRNVERQHLLNKPGECTSSKIRNPKTLKLVAEQANSRASEFSLHSEINRLPINMNINVDQCSNVIKEDVCGIKKSCNPMHSKASTKTQAIESQNYDESFALGPSKVYGVEESAITQSESMEENAVFWENQYCSLSGIVYKEPFKPLKIEEIEKKVFSQFNINLCEGKCPPMLSNQQSAHHPYSEFIGSLKNLNPSNFPRGLVERKDFDKLKTETLMFINCKLWESGELRILKIEELFKLFLQTQLEIRNWYCRNVEEFRNFLCAFPDDFVISKSNIMAKKNKNCKSFCTVINEEQSIPLMLLNFFNLYTKYNNFLHIRILYSQVGQYFCNINQAKIFKFPAELVLFLEMFPDIFYLDSNHIVNLTASNEKIENLNHKVLVHKHCTTDLPLENEPYSAVLFPESTKNWKDVVLQKTQLIQDLNTCKFITEGILRTEKVIALDCEGVNLGAAGILTLVQIGLENGQVYIFDIVQDKNMIQNGGLIDILESESIVKVIHDSRNDIANLYTEYAVKVNNIFDTRIAHHLILNPGLTSNQFFYKVTAIGFNELCAKYSVPINIEKDEMKNVYKLNNMFWNKRPLTNEMLAYAALDVASLVPHLYRTMLRELKGKSRRLVWQLSLKHSISVLNTKELLFD